MTLRQDFDLLLESFSRESDNLDEEKSRNKRKLNPSQGSEV